MLSILNGLGALGDLLVNSGPPWLPQPPDFIDSLKRRGVNPELI